MRPNAPILLVARRTDRRVGHFSCQPHFMYSSIIMADHDPASPEVKHIPSSSFAVVNASEGESDGHNGDEGLSLLRVCHDDATTRTWLDQVSTLLTQQWPRGGDTAVYRSKVIYGGNSSTSTDHYALPCSYLLLQGDKCVA